MLRTLFLFVMCSLMCPLESARGAESSDIALLIVYPDYPVSTDSFYGYTRQVGHAGVLLISSKGLTKYYEFGRYDAEKHGEVRNLRISNVEMVDGYPTKDSLAVVLAQLSKKSGKGGRIRAARFVGMDFEAMNRFAEAGKFSKYSATDANCGHFAEAVILKGNPRVDRPTIVNFTPNNFVDEYIEEGNAEVTYDPTVKKLTIGDGDEADAKRPVR